MEVDLPQSNVQPKPTYNLWRGTIGSREYAQFVLDRLPTYAVWLGVAWLLFSVVAFFVLQSMFGIGFDHIWELLLGPILVIPLTLWIRASRSRLSARVLFGLISLSLLARLYTGLTTGEWNGPSLFELAFLLLSQRLLVAGAWRPYG